MNELLNKLQRYIKAYKEPPYGKEVEGTTELMEEASQTLVKTAHRVVLLENQFIDGMYVTIREMMKWMVLSVLYANMKLQVMMIMQKCDQSIVQNVAQNLFIRIL